MTLVLAVPRQTEWNIDHVRLELADRWFKASHGARMIGGLMPGISDVERFKRVLVKHPNNRLSVPASPGSSGCHGRLSATVPDSIYDQCGGRKIWRPSPSSIVGGS